MKRKYNVKQVFGHFLMYPLRPLMRSAARKRIYEFLLRHRNSIPIYLAILPGSTAVQVGTPNIVTMKRFSRYVGKNGKIVIVEAEPSNVAKLTAAASELNLHNVSIVGKGAWNSKGTLALKVSDSFDGDHRFDVEALTIDNDLREHATQEIVVEVDTVDSILSDLNIEKVDYLSVTVNGAELEVLQGAKNTIQNSPDILIYSKGHGRITNDDGYEPLCNLISEHLSSMNLTTVISKGERSSATTEWGVREGDVVAWHGITQRALNS